MSARLAPGRGWDMSHNPEARPLGCNGKYGRSGVLRHRRQQTEVCDKCRDSNAHYMRELRRGQGTPRRLAPCGTEAAARRHRYNGEPVDFACRVATAEARQADRDRAKSA